MFFFFRYYCYFYSVIFSVNLVTLLRASFITFYLQTSCLIQIKCMNGWTSLRSATTYADNVTLPAFTAAAVRRAAIDRYLLPAASAAKLWPMFRQTDGHYLWKVCVVYHLWHLQTMTAMTITTTIRRTAPATLAMITISRFSAFSTVTRQNSHDLCDFVILFKIMNQIGPTSQISTRLYKIATFIFLLRRQCHQHRQNLYRSLI